MPDNPQSWNRYAYVGGTPLSAVDPLGLCPLNPQGCAVGLGGPARFLFQGCGSALAPTGGLSTEFLSFLMSGLNEVISKAEAGFCVVDDQGGESNAHLADAIYHPNEQPRVEKVLWPHCASSNGPDGGRVTLPAAPAPAARPTVSRVFPQCAPSGDAMPPQGYLALGVEASVREIDLDAPGSDLMMLAGMVQNAQNILSFYHGGPLDAQARGGSVAYANYVYGLYMSASGVPLATTLWGANAYGGLFANYRSGTIMDARYGNIPASNVANITEGYNAASGGNVCIP